MLPPAPPRLSGITCTPRPLVRRSAAMRPMRSVGPPGGNDQRTGVFFANADAPPERPRPHFQLRKRRGEPQRVRDAAFLADAGAPAALQLVGKAGPIAFFQAKNDGAELVRRGDLAQTLDGGGPGAKQPVKIVEPAV